MLKPLEPVDPSAGAALSSAEMLNAAEMREQERATSYLRWFLLLSRLAFYLYRAYWSRPFPIDDLAPARCAHCGGMVWNGAMHLHRSPRRSGCERPRCHKRNRHVHVHVRHRDSGAARTVLSRD